MAVYIKTYDLSKVKSIPDDTYRWCRRNNFESGLKADLGHTSSCIRAWLGECVEEAKGVLLVAHDGQRYLGWGLTYQLDDWYRKPWEFQVYVPPRFRRRGIGTKILAKACAKVGRVQVFAHDVSDKFYMANGLTKNEAISGKRLKSRVGNKEKGRTR